MRVLIVNYRYFISGGPEKYMFNIKKLLEEHGHEVIPFSIHSNKNIETEYSKYFVEPIGNREATYFDEVKKTPKSIIQMISRSFYSFEVKEAIKKEIKDVKPDLVYIIHFVNKLSPSVIRGAKEMGVPVVLRLSDYFMLCPRFDFLYGKKVCEDCIKKGYKSCIKKRCVKNSLFASTIRVCSMKYHKLIRVYDDIDAFITPSKFLKNKLITNGYEKNKIYYIPTFTRSINDNTKNAVGKYGLYFGRITEEKGVDTLVKAYKEMPDKSLKIMGDDTTDEAIRLKKIINDEGIKNINFIGFKEGKELEKTIQDSRYVLIPSIWYDNLPNTALEAFQYYKPVIASNIGSLPELVENEYNGFLFEPGNYRDLKRMINLLDDDKIIKEMGNNSHKKLIKDYSSEKHYDELISLFERLIAKKGDYNEKYNIGRL